jgi:hypothetical protein
VRERTASNEALTNMPRPANAALTTAGVRTPSAAVDDWSFRTLQVMSDATVAAASPITASTGRLVFGIVVAQRASPAPPIGQTLVVILAPGLLSILVYAIDRIRQREQRRSAAMAR